RTVTAGWLPPSALKTAGEDTDGWPDRVEVRFARDVPRRRGNGLAPTGGGAWPGPSSPLAIPETDGGRRRLATESDPRCVGEWRAAGRPGRARYGSFAAARKRQSGGPTPTGEGVRPPDCLGNGPGRSGVSTQPSLVHKP